MNLSNHQLVAMMHKKFQLLDRDEGPRTLTQEEYVFRITAMMEELLEYTNACSSNFSTKEKLDSIMFQFKNILNNTEFDNEDLEDQFDALLDLAVFTIGTADRQNFPWDEGFMRVMEANMGKELGSNGDKRGGFKRDLIKPDGWKAPDLSDLVNTPIPRIVVLEGADGTGKTSIAKYLEENYNAYVIHRTWSPDLEKVMDDYLLDSVNDAISVLQAHNRMVVIDRSFLSEWIYSKVFRNGTQWKGLHRAMCNGLNGLDAVFVLCSTSDKEMYREHFSALKDNREEMYDSVDKMQKINHLYHKIVQKFGALDFIGPNLALNKFISYDIANEYNSGSPNPAEKFVEHKLIPMLRG